MTANARPNNHPFNKPPALSTRGSATELYVAPHFTSPASRPLSVPESSTVFQYPSPQAVISAQPSQPSVTFAASLPMMATSSASQASAAAATTMPVIIDTTFAPSVFRGLLSDDAEMWLASFERYTNFRRMSPENKLTFLPVLQAIGTIHYRMTFAQTGNSFIIDLKNVLRRVMS